MTGCWVKSRKIVWNSYPRSFHWVTSCSFSVSTYTMLKQKALRIEQKPPVIACAEQYGIERAAAFYKIRPGLIEKWIREKDKILAGTERRRKLQVEYMKKRAEQEGFVYKDNPEGRRKWYGKHVFKRMIKNLKGNLRRKRYDHETATAFELWAIAKRQRNRCALSGLPLTIHNISIDHIIPLSKGGNSLKGNLQLLDKRINQMKHVMSEKELIELCRSIVKTADEKIRLFPTTTIS